MDQELSSLTGTFNQSIRSVGTAVTLALIGVYLHQRGFVAGDGKRTLALISQQVTFPLFLFTKIIYCNQNWSDEPCPEVTQSLRDGWVLIIWPAYVVGCGLLVGLLVAKMAGTPQKQVRSVLAACMFGNSTGLPVTLLTVVHANFSATSNLGKIDPVMFLSVYLLLYPVLQWGVGGWLLTPQEPTTTAIEENTKEQQENGSEIDYDMDDDVTSNDGDVDLYGTPNHDASHEAFLQQATRKSPSFKSNVLNNKRRTSLYAWQRRGIDETDASMYISDADLFSTFQRVSNQIQFSPGGTPITPGAVSLPPPEIQEFSPYQQQKQQQQQLPQQYYTNTSSCPQPRGSGAPPPAIRTPSTDSTGSPPDLRLPFVPPKKNNDSNTKSFLPAPVNETTALLPPSSTQDIVKNNSYYSEHSKQLQEEPDDFSVESFLETLQQVAARCLQPPVIGAMLGIFVAVTPLRGIFVDIVDRSSHAPLQWFFDGLYAAGLAAVPINMMILGCNLSASYNARKLAKETGDSAMMANLLSMKTMSAIVFGKMIIMPIIGVASCFILRNYVLHINDEIDGAFFLVMMIVFITPTANNVMVMVELSGSDTKEGIASCIAVQYAVAPVILSLTMSVVIGIASDWT